MNFKTLGDLITYMNDNSTAFGWKSRCEALTAFAEKLENQIEKMKRCSNCRHCRPDLEMIEYCLNESKCRRTQAYIVKSSTMPETIQAWPDMWKLNELI